NSGILPWSRYGTSRWRQPTRPVCRVDLWGGEGQGVRPPTPPPESPDRHRSAHGKANGGRACAWTPRRGHPAAPSSGNLSLHVRKEGGGLILADRRNSVDPSRPPPLRARTTCPFRRRARGVQLRRRPPLRARATEVLPLVPSPHPGAAPTHAQKRAGIGQGSRRIPALPELGRGNQA